MADFSDFTSGIKSNLTPDGKGILNRKIDFQREKFLKGVSTTKHGKKEDPTYLYFKFVFDFGDTGIIDPTTFLPPSPLFRSTANLSGREQDNLIERTSEKNTRNSDNLAPGQDAGNNDAIREVTEAAAGTFYTTDDFFYTSKSKIAGAQGKLFYNINGSGVAYMGAQQFLAQRSAKRQQMLQAFKNGINFINKECPYYFQSLSGLDNLLKVDIKNYHKAGGAPKRTGTLTIDCLESIDMRVFSLAELYRKAVYDYTYHRIMVPENLRKFRMWLVITELRNIQLTYGVNDLLNPFTIPSVSQAANFLDSFNSQTGLLDKVQGIYDKSTKETPDASTIGTYSMGPYTFIYQFDQCEFDFDSTYPSYGTIDAKGGQAVNTSFKIHVGRVQDYKIQFNQLADVLKKDNNIQQMVLADVWGSPGSSYVNYDYVSTQGIESVTFSDKPNPGEYFAKLASDFVTNTAADLKNQGVSILQGALLGNIYGLGGVNAQQAASSVQSLVSTIKGGVPNPFAKNDPQSNGYGGPNERQYPRINEDLYPNSAGSNGGSLGNVLPGTGQPGGSINTDVYNNNPGKDLGLPDRQYPINNSDEYNNVPGADLGAPDRVYPIPGGDQYPDNPGADLGLPDRQYPVNNSDEYNNVPGSDLGVPSRVYTVPGGDQYPDNPGADLGLPGRQYPANNSDEYNNVPGSDLGVPDRVYTVPGGDQYPNNPGSDLGLPNRQYAPSEGDEYENVPGSDLGVNGRIYPAPGGDQYPNNPGSDLGLPNRQYAPSEGDEYENVPGQDLGVGDRIYKQPEGDQYKNTPGSDLGLPDRQYPAAGGDGYENVPGRDLGPRGRVYDFKNEDKYQNTPGPDLGLPSRQYENSNGDEYKNTPGSDLGPKGRVYESVNEDLYKNTPGSDLGLPDRQYSSNNTDEYDPSLIQPNTNLGRIYQSNKSNNLDS